MMLFWLRFFGYKRTAWLNKSYRDDPIASAAAYKPRKSIVYDPASLCPEDSVAPLEHGVAAARKQSNRRTAIDLGAGRPSIELGVGPTVRLSLDSMAAGWGQQCQTAPMSVYTNVSTLHRGRHSKIMRATHKHTGAYVALKIFDKGKLTAVQQEDIAKEVHILRLLKGNDGIVEFEKRFEDEFIITVVLKECTRGSLVSRLAASGGRMAEGACVHHVVKPLVAALALLHEKRIVHRNLKLEHILYDECNQLRLVDFLSAAVMGKTPLTGREGTLAYMAPEVLTKPTPHEVFHEVIRDGISEADLPSYDEKVDIWSMGVVVVEVLTGRQPFAAVTAEAMCRVQRQEVQGDQFGGVLDLVRDQQFLSLEGQDFLSSIFRLDPKERPSAAELLSHPWLELTDSDGGEYEVA